MAKVYAFLADGLEEVECLAVVDVLRRSGIETVLVSVSGKQEITGSHGIRLMADVLFEEADPDQADILFLPGGMPGTLNLGADKTVNDVIRKFAAEGKLVCAICAAPSVLGVAGLLEGKRATCHPGFEDKLIGAVTSEDEVVVCDNIITSRGMGTAIPFAFEIVRYFTDDETVETVRKGLVYRE